MKPRKPVNKAKKDIPERDDDENDLFADTVTEEVKEAPKKEKYFPTLDELW